MKTILLPLFLSTILFAATAEQVEQYLNVSSTNEGLIELESSLSSMQAAINNKESNTSQRESTYDMQMLSIRYKEYLQKALSEEEMDAILENYKKIVLLEFISAAYDDDYSYEAREAYVKKVEHDPELQNRISMVRKISKAFHKKESLMILFDNLIQPFLKQSKGGNKIDGATMKQKGEAYIKMLQKEYFHEALYATREFSDEELEALLKIAKSTAADHEAKANSGATAYALKEYYLSIAPRYDMKKHQKKRRTNDRNQTK